MVDSTYRWTIVLLLTAALTATLVPVAYRKGFPTRMPLEQIVGAAILVGVGVVFARIFDEAIVDALLLRAQFGFLFPDTGVHGYGWAFVFGYGILFANLLVLAIGVVMTRLGRLPPWIDGSRDRKKSE